LAPSFVVTFWVGNCSILFSVGSLVPPTPDPGGSASREAKRRELVLQEKKGDRGWKLVQMSEEHLDDLLAIQYQCFEPHFCEEREAYIERMNLFPHGNVVLMVPKQTMPAVPAAKEGTMLKSSNVSGSSSAPDYSKLKDWNGYVIAGYTLFQPFVRGEVQDDGDSEGLAAAMNGAKFDCFYTHELSIAPAFRGKGLTSPLTNYVETQAKEKGYSWVTLVAVSSAEPFWAKNGYHNRKEISYGGVSCYYMEKPVPLLNKL